MDIYPAIDLKEGRCVRLYRGEMAHETRYNDDPLAQAQSFVAEGARMLHIVDLDAALSGTSRNGAVIAQILKGVSIPIQLGGGVRSEEAVEFWLQQGVARIVIATLALEEPQRARALCARYKERIALALDFRDKNLCTRGWVASKKTPHVTRFLTPFIEAGLGAMIVTDISRDGTLEGANVELCRTLARKLNFPVIASGGIASLADITRLAAEESIVGAICGRALYEGKFTLAQAQGVAQGVAQGTTQGTTQGTAQKRREKPRPC